MPYATGTAADFVALANAIVSACAANGWTSTPAASALSKGNVHVQLTPSGTSYLRIKGGTGVSGSSLSNITANYAQMYGATFHAITWPATYYIHINTAPDCVNVFLESGGYWQWLFFCQGESLGVTGSCAAFGASCHSYNLAGTPSITIYRGPASVSPGIGHNAIPFGVEDYPYWEGPRQNCFIRIEHKGCNWGNDTALNTSPVRADYVTYDLSAYATSTFAVWPRLMVPFIIWGRRTTGSALEREYLARLPNHMLWTRNHDLADGEVRRIGRHRWKIYPMRFRNLTWWQFTDNAVADGNLLDHSGTHAIAVRYDGP